MTIRWVTSRLVTSPWVLHFEVHCADVAKLAFGHYSNCLSKTHILEQEKLSNSLVAILSREKTEYLIAGGDIVANICADLISKIQGCGPKYVGNNPATVRICSDKYLCVKSLERATL
jgi:hypothetical protein